MNAEQFEKITGTAPIQDDLERANCPHAGDIGHSQCGICERCNKPRFLCLCDTLALAITLLEDHAKLTPAAEEQLERLKNNPPKG